MSLSRFSFRNAQGVLLTAIFLSILGGVAYRRMAASILPDFPFPRIAIIVEAGDMAIQDVVVRLTRPLESAGDSVPGAKRIVSKTSRGAAEISIDFEWGTDLFEAFTRLNAAIAQIRSSLPLESSIQVEWVNPSSFPILGYSMTSSKRRPAELREIATLTVAPYLGRLNGIYRVLVQGGEVREFDVLLQPSALAAAGITPEEVSAALASTNLLQSVGRISAYYQSHLVIGTAQITEVRQILDTVVATRPGRPIRVRDVAQVKEGTEELQEVTTADGHEAVLVNVLKQQGASTALVSGEVRRALNELHTSNAVPDDVVFRAFYDEAELLRDSIGSLRDAILIGGVLGMLVLWFFLGSLRMTLIVLLCIPMTVVMSFLALTLLHGTLNIMTLGGLAVGLGLIIDDVVVTMENVFRRVETGATPVDAATDGTYEIQKPMLGSTVTRIAVFVPLAFLSGITGAFFAPLAVTLTAVLVISVALALTVVPLVCAPLVRTRIDPTAGPRRWLGRLRDSFYPRVLGWALRRSLGVVALTVLVVVFSVVLFRILPTGFMPAMDEGAFVLDYLAAAGTTLEDTDRLCRVIEQELLRTPEVESYARRTGLELGFFATDPNRGDVSVKLKPRSRRKRSMNEVMDDVRGRCEARLPSVTFESIAPLADRVADIAGEPSPIEAKVFGDDPKVLAELADHIAQIVANVRGTTESVHNITRSGPELTVRIDPDRAGRAGLTPQQVIDRLETTLFGRAETVVRSGERLIGIRVLYPKSLRRTLGQIAELPILTPNGELVPLGSIADLAVEPGYFEITRENQKPMIPVTAQLENRDLGSANAEVQRRVAEAVKFPSGYTVQYGGLYQTQQEAFRSLLTVLVLGMALVFIALVCQYHGFAEATALMASAVVSLSGVVLALWVTGVPFNASSFTGGIMVFGMVLANGILLMDAIHDGLAEGLPLREAIVHGGRLRIRPVLMTSAIATLTLLPLAFGIGAGAEMQQPLAVASIGGLACSPVFTLVLAPTLLYLLRPTSRVTP